MLRVQKSRRPSISSTRQSPLLGRFLSVDDDGNEVLLDVLQPQDPSGPPSRAEYGLETGLGMRMYRGRQQQWNVRSVAAKRLWMDKKWRNDVLEKRRKTRGGKDADQIKNGAQQLKHSWKNYTSADVGLDTRAVGELSRAVRNGDPYKVKRNDVNFKKQRMLARSQVALDRHKKMKISKDATINQK